MKKIKINKLCFSKNVRTLCKLFGKMEKRILEPSSGGIGTRLKVAKMRLIKTIRAKAPLSDGRKPERIKSPRIKAIQKFESGPARATKASPHL